MQTQIKSVQFTMDNVMKCQCGSCPVQGESQCAIDKMRSMKSMMPADPSGGLEAQPMGQMMAPRPEMVPGMYCSTGTASCGDLDFMQKCICPTCAVWQENDLGSMKYCRNGSAADNG